MISLDSKRTWILFAAVLAVAVPLLGAATARASSHAAYVTDYQSRDWCDPEWDDWCDPGWDDPPADPPPAPDPQWPEDPQWPQDPTGPTGPVQPPVTYWPAPPRGAVAKLRANGRTAVAPKSAPPPVKAMIKAANSLTRKPYVWGGGHGKWHDRGYDCSGAVSYVLHAGNQLSWPMVSGALAKWGNKGRGRWIQVYANSGHVFMVIAGLRFDTSGRGESGPRWRVEPRFTKGFRLRHPAGL